MSPAFEFDSSERGCPEDYFSPFSSSFCKSVSWPGELLLEFSPYFLFADDETRGVP